METVIGNVRPFGGDPVDLVVTDGRIVERRVRQPGAAEQPGASPTDVFDGHGRIALPGFVDAHAHLDKTTWGGPYRPHTAEPGLASLVQNERQRRRELPPVAERATALLREYVALGTTLVRSHVDVDTDAGLDSVEGVLQARSELADRVRVDVVAFPQSGLLTRTGTAELLDAAVRQGADVVGGIDPAGFDRDPKGHLDTVFGIADRRGVPVDIHLHDRGELGAWQLELIVERARALSMPGRVTVSHAFALATVETQRAARLIEQLADADVAITTAVPGSGPMLPVRELLAAGVRLGAGNDGVRDLWSPYGTGDMLERAMLLAWRCGFRAEADLITAVEVASGGGCRVIEGSGHGLEVGDRADMVLLDGPAVGEVLARRPGERTVISGGRVVSGPAQETTRPTR